MIRATICLATLLVPTLAAAEWRYEEVAGNTGGTTAHLIQVDSSIAIKGNAGKESYPYLQFRCDKDGGQAYARIHWFAIVDTKLGSSSARDAIDNVRLQVRVDGKPDFDEMWDMTRDASLEGVVTYRASAWVKALRDANEMKVRISGGYGKSYDATFDVSGLGAAAQQLKRHCRKL
jgi:hypothetical protein